MTQIGLTEYELTSCLVRASTWFAAGALIGAFHFLTLQCNVWILLNGQSLLLSAGIQIMRFAVIAPVLAAVARFFGALPLFAAATGILAARSAIIQWGAPS